MVTVDQFLKALAVVESSDNPEAWGDAGRAMGRWQVHPDRLFAEMKIHSITPRLGETWDQLGARVLRTIFQARGGQTRAAQVAMYWHLGHWAESDNSDWDAKYAARFGAALMNAQEEMP